MDYLDGRKVKIGDRVKLGKEKNGIVVCSIDDGEYSEDYPREFWSRLEKGVLFNFPSVALIYRDEPLPDIEFVSRRPK